MGWRFGGGDNRGKRINNLWGLCRKLNYIFVAVWYEGERLFAAWNQSQITNLISSAMFKSGPVLRKLPLRRRSEGDITSSRPLAGLCYITVNITVNTLRLRQNHSSALFSFFGKNLWGKSKAVLLLFDHAALLGTLWSRVKTTEATALKVAEDETLAKWLA